MNYLVMPITKRMPIAAGTALIAEAHAFLVDRCRSALADAAQLPAGAGWGTAAKRIRVDLAVRPGGVPRAALLGQREHESLVEVLNQCATIERLLDTLAWASEQSSGLGEHDIVVCNPTTSNVVVDGFKNDLVLAGPNGTRAIFEVADVAGAGDGNRKEAGSLRALGVLAAERGETMLTIPAWPKARLFLAVSRRFLTTLTTGRRRMPWLVGPEPHCHYVCAAELGETGVIEVRQGRPNATRSS